MSPMQSDQCNRVKIITSKFECLNDQSSSHVKKSNSGKDLHLQKTCVSRLKSDTTSENCSPPDTVSNGNFTAREKFGSSYNFGNRKRLKEQNENEHFIKPAEKNYHHPIDSSLDNVLYSRTKLRTSSLDIDFKQDLDENSISSVSSLKILSRQNSDPAKKLHRSPAFRCDRSEKFRDSNSKCNFSRSPQFCRQSDRCTSKDKLKILGSMIEERLKEDELTFSNMNSKMNFKEKLNADLSKPKMKSNYDKNKINEDSANRNLKLEQMDDFSNEILSKDIRFNDNNIPQHVLDMYAKVLKPKIKHGMFHKTEFIPKIDGVFSDSGVSSESENLISDDLDELKTNSDNIVETINNNIDINNESIKINMVTESKKTNSVLNNSSLSIDEEILSNNDALKSGLVSVDTLKKILKQPLPVGPPPKKPPRTFTSLSEISPKKTLTKISSKFQNDTKTKLKNSNSKNKPHRSREESKLMLEKIEDALKKHKNTGKILSPRLNRKITYEQNETLDQYTDNVSVDSVSTVSTLPSKVRLPSQNNTKINEKNNQPEEIHYMCTEILDLNFSEQNNPLNLSNSSITSFDEIQTGNSFTKCLNSLNCAGGNVKNNSTAFYSKFGSPPNSANASFTDVCCYCNLNDTRKHSNGNAQPDNTVRLSTFYNPNKSLECAQNVKCRRCCFNDTRQSNFKCHLDCKCAENETGNSSFFIENSGESQYGSLIKSKSQEHIYDEPANILKNLPNDDNDNLPNDCLKRSSFTRSATQLEDAFRKYNVNKNLEDEQRLIYDSNEFTRNDFKSKTLGRISLETKNSKVNDILRSLENNRVKSEIDFSNRISIADKFNRNSGRKVEDLSKNSKLKQLHYMYSNIYDTPPAEISNDSNEIDENFNKSSSLSFVDIVHKNDLQSNNVDKITPNCSALYDIHMKEYTIKDEQKSTGKPPLYEKRNKDSFSTSTTKRPQNFELKSDKKFSKVALLRKKLVDGHMTEIEKRNLDHLMTEIYDTVTAECLIESPTKDGKISENGSTSKLSANLNDKEMSEASLKLTRSLTEKRKKYVRRVSSKIEFVAPLAVGSIKRNRFLSMKSNDEKLKDNFTSSLPISYDFKKVKAVFEQDVVNKEIISNDNTLEVQQDLTQTIVPFGERLFEACILIGMNFSTGQPVVKSVFPENATLPPQIESLVFPELINDSGNDESQTGVINKHYKFELTAEDSQTYSLVLTNEHGLRTYGYCRRVVPEGAPFCLPLAYCIITPYRFPAFYYKVLLEIEIHHGSSEVLVKSILDQLYSEKLPIPGHCIHIQKSKSPIKKSLENFKKNSLHRSSLNLREVHTTPSNNFEYSDGLRRKSADLTQKFPEIFSGTSGLTMVESLEKLFGEEVKEYQKKKTEHCGNLLSVNCKKSGNIKRATSDQRVNVESESVDLYKSENNNLIKFLMPLEPRLEEDNLSILYDSISVNVLVKIFGTLLLERKVIIVGDKLSQLSSCIEALQLILYPFTWQHAIISIIPSYLRRDLLEAPIPILAGVLCSKSESNGVKRKFSDTDNKIFNKEKSPKLENSTDSSEFTINDFYEEVKFLNFEEGIIVDITSKNNFPSEKIVKSQCDESTLLPPVLAKTLSAALKLGPPISTVDAKSDNHAKKSRNILIAEAFLRFFILLLGDYPNFLTNSNNSTFYDSCENDKDIIFDKENFIKSSSSKHIQYFLEWFTETAMFCNFIKNKCHRTNTCSKNDIEEFDRLPYPDFYHLFDERIALLVDSKKQYTDSSKNTKHESGSHSKGNYKSKIKTWRAKLKDLIN